MTMTANAQPLTTKLIGFLLAAHGEPRAAFDWLGRLMSAAGEHGQSLDKFEKLLATRAEECGSAHDVLHAFVSGTLGDPELWDTLAALVEKHGIDTIMTELKRLESGAGQPA